MRLVVRTWSFNRDGQQCILEPVEIDPSIYEKTRTWMQQRKELLLRLKYTQPDSDHHELWERLNRDFNSFVKTLPVNYQRDTPQFMAIAHLYTLYSDNPELIPSQFEGGLLEFDVTHPYR